MDLRDKTGLLIDDMPEMRATVRIQLADGGLEKCDQARNIKEAVDRLSTKAYDLIVCDYNLGQGADGQQLLELLRRRKLLPLTTAFLIITGETGYEQVSTAAEYAPDDYLIKPFTADILRTRLSRILDKKAALEPIYRHLGPKQDAAAALAACDKLLAENTRYSLDVLRHKGELLMELKRGDEALALYDGILQQRATPWATLGKAKALMADGNEDEAEAHLARAIEAYPNYLAAYDSMAELLAKTDTEAAQAIVEQALIVAPTTQRQRRMGALALENKDFSRAEAAYKVAVEKDRTGFFKTHDDYAGLARSYSEQGKTKEALGTVKDMGQHFPRSPELEARQAAVECQVHVRAGDKMAAKAALDKAMSVAKAQSLDANTQLELAQACFASGAPEEAKRIIQAVAEDHTEHEPVLAQARKVFATAGLQDEGDIFLEAARKRMVALNNDAVALAKAGQLDEAVAMLKEAADRLPNNCQVAINAAQALLMHAHRSGGNPEHIAAAHRYISQARNAAPDNPKLADVETFYRRVAPADAPPLA